VKLIPDHRGRNQVREEALQVRAEVLQGRGEVLQVREGALQVLHFQGRVGALQGQAEGRRGLRHRVRGEALERPRAGAAQTRAVEGCYLRQRKSSFHWRGRKEALSSLAPREELPRPLED